LGLVALIYGDYYLWFSALQFTLGGKEGMLAFFGIVQIPSKQIHILLVSSNRHDFLINRLFF